MRKMLGAYEGIDRLVKAFPTDDVVEGYKRAIDTKKGDCAIIFTDARSR